MCRCNCTFSHTVYLMPTLIAPIAAPNRFLGTEHIPSGMKDNPVDLSNSDFGV